MLLTLCESEAKAAVQETINVKLCKCFLWECRRLTAKKIGCFNIFYMILKAIFASSIFVVWCNVIHCKSAYKDEFHCYLCSWNA